MLGIEERHAEDALHSERVARHVTRRGFLGAAGALAGGAVFSFATPAQDEAERLTGTRFLRDDGTWIKPSGSSLTRFDAMLKERYRAETFECYFDEPFLKHIKTEEPRDRTRVRVLILGQNAQHTLNGSFSALYDRRPLTGT